MSGNWSDAMPVKKLYLKKASKPRGKDRKPSARLSPYLRGIVYGMHLAGATLDDVHTKLRKPDRSKLTPQGAWACVQLCEENGGVKWDGDASKLSSSGRPRETTAAMDHALTKLVFKHRGSAIVTVAFLQRVLPEWRAVSPATVERRLGDAGLAWLRRRRKSLVPTKHKPARCRWGRWVPTVPAAERARWAYTDGASFYLARTGDEAEDKSRAALGPYVWRQASGSDALYEDCVGPSAYWKAQGLPVRVWGFLANGVLHITVLPRDQCVNRWWYEWVVAKKFPVWIKASFGVQKRGAFLLQDHERCLWAKEPRDAMEAIGLNLLDNFPKCSQDLNPIETVWRELRSRLAETQPTTFEDRDVFFARLRAAVAWVNRNRAEFLHKLCNCQAEWASDVLAANGARTKH